jgi:hypothetical protein
MTAVVLRTARASVGGLCYHVVNRGNARGEVFHKDDDDPLGPLGKKRPPSPPARLPLGGRRVFCR